MKVENMRSARGNKVANQFKIKDAGISYKSRTGETIYPPSGTMFQSYASNIAFKTDSGVVFLDEEYWDYSKTTSRYRNQFLGENKKETQKKIDSGEYKLVNLN
jgi:hypothetical protein